MAAVVPYLRQLKDAGIPVLWRPFHEMNETWNWWGGRPGANGGAKIYQQMRDYFDSQGLDNLIWVWNVQDNPAGGWASYYPGSNYVDVVSLDAWYKSYPSASDYQQIQSIAAGKPIAHRRDGQGADRGAADQPAEVDLLHDLVGAVARQQHQRRDPGDVLPAPRAQPGRDQLRRHDDLAADLADLAADLAGPGRQDPRRGQREVRRRRRALRRQRHARCSSTPVTAGGSAQAWTAGSDGTVRALGKCLDAAGGVDADGTKVQIWDCIAGSPNQQWRYNATAQTFTNTATGRCLDATGQGTADRTRLQVWTCNGQANQRWTRS